MNIVFLIVHRFASVLLAKSLRIKWSIKNLSIHPRVPKSLIRNDFQECCASRSWPSKHKNHLPGFRDSSEVLQNLELLPLLSNTKNIHRGLHHIEEANESIRKGLHEIR